MISDRLSIPAKIKIVARIAVIETYMNLLIMVIIVILIGATFARITYLPR